MKRGRGHARPTFFPQPGCGHFRWDAEHDAHVLRLLVLMEQELEAQTVRAFRRVALDGARAAEVASD
jgi:hypothetical protein